MLRMVFWKRAEVSPFCLSIFDLSTDETMEWIVFSKFVNVGSSVLMSVKLNARLKSKRIEEFV